MQAEIQKVQKSEKRKLQENLTSINLEFNGNISQNLSKTFTPTSSLSNLTSDFDYALSNISNATFNEHPVLEEGQEYTSSIHEDQQGMNRSNVAKTERQKISKSAENRISVCVLVKYAGMSVYQACKTVGINKSTFSKTNWYSLYEKNGMNGLLLDNRSGSSHKITPKTRQNVLNLAKDNVLAPEISQVVAEKWTHENIVRNKPHLSTITRVLKNSGAKYCKN